MAKYWQYFILLLWLSYLLISGLVLFFRGFLLNREVQSDRSFCDISTKSVQCDSQQNEECFFDQFHFNQTSSKSFQCLPSNKKVVLVVIDALKYDFVEYNENVKKDQLFPYQNQFTVIQELLQNKPNHSRLFRFIADPPTTTMQRLKGLTTGSLPTFIDIGSNFASTEINEDNILDQLTSRNKSILFLGDDTWTGLYPGRFLREYSYPSFNVWDLDSVDNGILSHLYKEVKKEDWNLLIAHFLGVDHCGHRYGPYHNEMKRKLSEMNIMISNLIDNLDNNTILFVIGDHGMTSSGDHGGASDAEVTAAWFVYSPQQPLFTVDKSLQTKSVKQVDLVPTLSHILGLPVPYSNLGMLVLEAIPVLSWRAALTSLLQNARQISNYIHKYPSANQFPEERLKHLQETFEDLDSESANAFNFEQFIKSVHKLRKYMAELRTLCEEIWVQFDPQAMVKGLILTSIVLVFFLFFVIGSQLVWPFTPKWFLAATGVNLLTIFSCYGTFLAGLVANLEQTIYFTSGIISSIALILGIGPMWSQITERWQRTKLELNWSIIGSRLLVVFSLLALFSNSFVIHEASISVFMLLSLLWLFVYHHRPRQPETQVTRGKPIQTSTWAGWRLAGFTLLVSILCSIGRHYWRCREEQPGCDWRKSPPRYRSIECLLALASLALLVSATRMWLRSCGNLVGFSAAVSLARYGPSVAVVCSGGYWLVQGLPSDARAKLLQPWQLHLLPWIVYMSSIAAFVTAAFRPLCVYIVPRRQDSIFGVYGQANVIPRLFNHMRDLMHEESNEKQPIVFGLATAYSSAILSVCVFGCLLVALLLGVVLAPSIFVLACQAACILTITAIARTQVALNSAELLHVPWPAVACWGFLATHSFYLTGHQPALAAIQWEAAFVGTSGQFASGGDHLVPTLLVLLNTYAGHIVLALALPLLLIAPFTIHVMFPRLLGVKDSRLPELRRGEMFLFEREELLNQGMFDLVAKYLLYHGLRVLAAMLSSTFHCRHLMVWKIFAPKLIFEALALIVTVPCALASFLLIARISEQIGRLFERLEKEHSS